MPLTGAAAPYSAANCPIASYTYVVVTAPTVFWTRRPSPFFASLGQSTVECSVPVARPETLAELATILTAELKGILTGAGRIHAQMVAGEDWKSVAPP